MAKNTGTAVGYSFANISTQTTTVVKTGEGILHSITINTPNAAGNATVYDSTTGTGTKIATIVQIAAPQPITLIYDIAFQNGLTVVTNTATADFTVTFI